MTTTTISPATVAAQRFVALSARHAALRAAETAIGVARQDGTIRGGVIRYTATTAVVSAIIATETRHEGIYPDRPTLVPVARQSLADVTIPRSVGRPVRTTPDPDLPQSAYDWYDLDSASDGAVLTRTSSDGYTIRARRLPRSWDVTRDRWIGGVWEVAEDIRHDSTFA